MLGLPDFLEILSVQNVQKMTKTPLPTMRLLHVQSTISNHLGSAILSNVVVSNFAKNFPSCLPMSRKNGLYFFGTQTKAEFQLAPSIEIIDPKMQLQTPSIP